MRLALMLAGFVAAAAPALAQTSALPEDVRAKMKAVGPIWGTNIGAHVTQMENAFTPLLQAGPKDGVTIERDISYGPDPKQKLDVHKPAAARAGAAIVIFIHGGAYVRGDKRVNDEIYGNIPTWFARQGTLAINMTYRLAPGGAFPAGGEDVGLVVAWAKKNAAQYGADPEKIFVIGHSAGATHVATYAWYKKLHPASGPGLAGIVLMSGRYRLEIDPKDPNSRNMQAYFGSEVAQYADRSMINHIADSKIPVFVVVAEYDNPGLDVSGAELFAALCARDKACPRFTRLALHNHLSMVHHFNTADQALGREILEFMALGR